MSHEQYAIRNGKAQAHAPPCEILSSVRKGELGPMMVMVPFFIKAVLLLMLLGLAAAGLLGGGVGQCWRRFSVVAGPGVLTPGAASGSLPEDVAQALLHFATTPQVPQQSREEIAEVMGALLRRPSCNFLVFGMWHDSLLWATLNHGGRTVFLDESQQWIERMRERHPQLETYRVDYTTTLGDSERLLAAARERRGGECRPHQPIQASSCPLALSTHLPREVLSVQWDLILIDGPRSYKNASFPGRMSPIFTASVMARTRTAAGHVDIFLHDVSRPSERQFGQEFLCMSNMVKQVGDLWHFQIHATTSQQFCA